MAIGEKDMDDFTTLLTVLIVAKNKAHGVGVNCSVPVELTFEQYMVVLRALTVVGPGGKVFTDKL